MKAFRSQGRGVASIIAPPRGVELGALAGIALRLAWVGTCAAGLAMSAPTRAQDTGVPGHPHGAVVADAANTVVRIGGAVRSPFALTPDVLASLPRESLTATDHGQTARWEGVPLLALLERAGAPLGEALRGPKLALVVRVTAADGYVAVFALAELDPQFRKNPVLLADRRGGAALDARYLPYRLIVPGDARPARWVRQVVAIELISLLK